MTHVLFIQPNLEGIGGIEKVVPVLAQTYQEEGNEVSCLVFYGQIPKEQIFWKHAYALKETRTKHFFHKIYKIILRAKELSTYIKITNPDCVVVSAQGTSIIVLLAKMIGYISQPVIVYAHQSVHETDLRINFWLMKYVYKYADGFLCVSKGIESEILHEIKGSEGKTVTVYNTLPIKKEDFLSEDDAKFLATLQQPVYVTASRLEQIKGVDILVEMFIQLFKSHKGTLLIIGDGGLRKDLEIRIAQSGLEKNIVCIGYKDNPRQYMTYAQAYVSCARSEAFGLSLVEALAEGVAVIATDVPYGPREILAAPTGTHIEYPLLTDYGILFSDIADKETMFTRFTQALALCKDDSFQKNILKERAFSFDARKQIHIFSEHIERVLRISKI
jgi:glycosyltransferase involved in cell wall biosynthesis